jgi:hypothetical protein
VPLFLAKVWEIFNQYEISGYVASLKLKQRKRLRSLVYPRGVLLEVRQLLAWDLKTD